MKKMSYVMALWLKLSLNLSIDEVWSIRILFIVLWIYNFYSTPKKFQVQDSKGGGMFENDFSSGADGDISGGKCCGQMSEDELTHAPADQRCLRKRCDDGKPSHVI
jgi:hypothetical protein